MNKVPTINLSVCEYDKKRKVLKLASEYIGMPRSLFIKSNHTGKVVEFFSIGMSDPLFDEDGWDGEMAIYRPVEFVQNVDHLVIYHQY